MNANHKVLIFTDLDGSLLDRDTFKFDQILRYIKDLISKGISKFSLLISPWGIEKGLWLNLIELF